VECDRGGDIEFRSDGSSTNIQAEGIRSLGAVGIQQAATDGPLSARSAPLQQGTTYLIQLSRGKVLLRVVAVRGGSPGGRGRTPRPTVDPSQTPTAGGGATVVLLLEWRLIPE